MITENPLSFSSIKKDEHTQVKLIDLTEICQGGPVIGRLSINGAPIKRRRFGGPFYLIGDTIFVPAVIIGMISKGFQLSIINVKTLDINFIGETLDIIWITGIDQNIIKYNIDLDGFKNEFISMA